MPSGIYAIEAYILILLRYFKERCLTFGDEILKDDDDFNHKAVHKQNQPRNGGNSDSRNSQTRHGLVGGTQWDTVGHNDGIVESWNTGILES